MTGGALGFRDSYRVRVMASEVGVATGVGAANLAAILCYAPPVALVYVLARRPLRFGLGLAAVFLVGALPAWFDDSTVYRGRSFFGVLTVKSGYDPWGGDGNHPSHRLYHGNILHGKQFDDELRAEPVSYYYRNGPIGRLFGVLPGQSSPRDVAVIGLGTGTMAAYARPGDHFTFYEIDRAVKALTFDQGRYFSYVTDAKRRGAEVDIVLGDARLSLEREGTGRRYDLIVVDAFSSDAIPVHLMTIEALRVYRARLKDDGVIVFHTSNRYLALEPVVANLAAAEGMTSLMMSDDTRGNPGVGKTSSTWVAVANRREDFGALVDDPYWKPPPNGRVGVWSDDYSNLLWVFEWKGTN